MHNRPDLTKSHLVNETDSDILHSTSAGEKVVQDVLNYVAQSRFNFSIFQTIFSAQLSLKKSVAQNLYEHSEQLDKASDETDIWKQRSKELDKKLGAVNLENLDLKEIIT